MLEDTTDTWQHPKILANVGRDEDQHANHCSSRKRKPGWRAQKNRGYRVRWEGQVYEIHESNFVDGLYHRERTGR